MESEKIDIKTLGADIVQKAPRSNKWSEVPMNFGLKHERRENSYIISPADGQPGFPVELDAADVKLEGGTISIRRGAKPLTEISISAEMRTMEGCVYDPDECDSDGESGCTFCTGALLFCCGGGHTGFCAGVWGCP